MILRKDYVKLIQDGKAQVELDKTKDHNGMLNIIFPKRVDYGYTASQMNTYFTSFRNHNYGYRTAGTPFDNLPIIHASDIILDNTVIKVESEEHVELTKQENKMKTITLEQGQELIDMVDVSCSWKGKLLDLWAKTIVLKQEISVSEELLQQGKKDASQSQKEVIDRIFGKEKEAVNLLKETGIGERKLFLSDGCSYDCLISVYDKSTFWLSSDFLFSIDGNKLKVNHK